MYHLGFQSPDLAQAAAQHLTSSKLSSHRRLAAAPADENASESGGEQNDRESERDCRRYELALRAEASRFDGAERIMRRVSDVSGLPWNERHDSHRQRWKHVGVLPSF